jgi:hypothetical protein
MDNIVAVAAALSDFGASSMVVSRRKEQALVSQLAEELDSKPRQCGFESHRGHLGSYCMNRAIAVARSDWAALACR